MLILTRRVGESILIGDDVEVTVVEVVRGKVRLAIRAPQHTAIHRAEVLARIAVENQNAVPARPVARGAAEVALSFPDGLPGFRSHRSFVLADVEGHPGVRALVSQLDPAIYLLVVDATELAADYPVERAQIAARLEEEEVAVALVLTMPAAGPPSVDLLAPIVIGLESRRGVQVILEGEDLPIRCALGPALGNEPMTEVSR